MGLSPKLEPYNHGYFASPYGSETLTSSVLSASRSRRNQKTSVDVPISIVATPRNQNTLVVQAVDLNNGLQRRSKVHPQTYRDAEVILLGYIARVVGPGIPDR